jgi:hypothetical protein
LVPLALTGSGLTYIAARVVRSLVISVLGASRQHAKPFGHTRRTRTGILWRRSPPAAPSQRRRRQGSGLHRPSLCRSLCRSSCRSSCRRLLARRRRPSFSRQSRWPPARHPDQATFRLGSTLRHRRSSRTLNSSHRGSRLPAGARGKRPHSLVRSRGHRRPRTASQQQHQSAAASRSRSRTPRRMRTRCIPRCSRSSTSTASPTASSRSRTRLARV